MTRSSKILAALGGAGVALGLFAATAAAEERKFTYSATVTAASDYMFRGISFTDENPTINLYQELTYGIAYLAFWSSDIDNGDLGPWEQDIYLGIRPVTGPINWDLAAWYYLYGNRGSNSTFDVDYVEFKIGATWSPVTNWTLGATAYLTPDQGLASTENISIEGTLAYTLPKMGIFDTTVSGLVGHSNSGTNSDNPNGYWLGQQEYTYWNAGVKLTVEKFFMDFRYWDTSIDNGLADERFVASVGVNILP